MSNVFFKNYDLIDSKDGPGESFYSNMHKYKSIKDFLKKKRSKKRLKRLATIRFISRGIDFDIDQTISPIIGEGNSYQEAALIGGKTDNKLSLDDFENKNVSNLNIRRDYSDTETTDPKNKIIKPIIMQENVNGINREFDVSELENSFEQNNYYGIQDAGSNAYRDM